MSADEFVELIRAAIGSQLDNGGLTIDACATEFGISRRTLQRRLAKSGLTFDGLSNEVRLSLAKQLLADQIQSVAEIAAQLGYANASNFAKAFQRLSGLTPTEFRRIEKKR